MDNLQNEKQNLTLNSEIKIPTMQVAEVKEIDSIYSVGTIDESMLTDEERKIVDRYAKEISIDNVEQIVNYGISAQQNISEFSNSILKKVRTFDLGDIGESLRDLTIAIDATMEPEKRGFLGIFQKAKKSVGAIRANYAKAESNVDRIERDLQVHQSVLVQDVSMFQQMYELNLKYYKELTMYIFAGKKALDMAKEGKLQALKKKAEETQLQEDIHAYRDFDDLCYRFEKKIADLEVTRVIAIQSAPQVRMLQNNDREMLDKIQSSLANTIPLWRNQLVLSLGIEHAKRALDAQKALTEKTNELLRKNSEVLKMATIETAKESERPIVELETLHLCSKNLIDSVTEVVKIHEQGAAKRIKAQQELVKIEEELKQAMIEVKN